jgi:ribose/xylose/arabinose/galactoside ABC-type transport system permease subunit
MKINKKNALGEYLILIILLIMIISMSIARPVFLSSDNILNIARQISMVAIVGIGMTFVLIIGEIDLSVGHIACLSGIIVSICLRAGMSIFVSVIAAIATGLVLGLINGLVITYLSIPSFITTMGMDNIAYGIVLVITNAYPVTGLPESFKFLGRGYVGFIPFPVILMTICYVFAAIILKYVKFGRNMFAIGGNKEAAKLSGIAVEKNKVMIFAISGITAAFSGVILSSRLFSGQPSSGNSFTMDAIASCVIGGTSTTGGKGRMWGTLIGALIMGIIDNGMTLLGISTNWQYIVKGAIIIIAVGLDQVRNKN